ncbi:hypothetical protein FDECE_13711 [Fusarium decemcellulare]|nr:hypothetical protein FDECE_13711 [Fusarium decemcellulare]
MNSPDHLQDIFFEISQYLPLSSLVAWSLTCRALHDALTGVILHKLGRCQYRPMKEWREEIRPEYCPNFHSCRHLLDIDGGDLYPTTLSRAAVLVWAASRGHVRTVKNILSVEEMGPWIDTPVLSSGHGTSLGSLGMAPLHAAANGGHVDVIDLLVEYGANVEATVARNLRPIHFANNENAIMALVRHGSSIHPQGKSCVPPLTYILARNPDLSVIRCLVQLGCDINAPSWLGVTAIDAAIQAGNIEALQLLLDAGPDLSIWASGINSLISEAVQYHSRFRPCVAFRLIRVLTQYDASSGPITVESSLRQPAEASSAHDPENARCSWGPFGMISQKGIIPFTRLLLDTTDAAVGQVQDTEQLLSMANKLLDYGERLDSYRENSKLAKSLSNHTEFLNWLFMFLLHQLAGNFMSHSRQWLVQQPPIHFLLRPGYSLFKSDANTENDLSLFERLLGFGADPNERDSEGNTLLALLCQLPFSAFENQRRHNCSADELLLKHGVNINALRHAENCAMYGIVLPVTVDGRSERTYNWYFDSVPSRDCNLDVRDSNNKTRLGRVAAPSPVWYKQRQHFMWHRADFLDFLLEQGADVHARQGSSPDKPLCAGGTPLHFACYDCDPTMLRLLLDYGAGEDVNQLSDMGLTPLMLLEIAMRDGKLEAAQFEEMKQLLSDAGAV